MKEEVLQPKTKLDFDNSPKQLRMATKEEATELEKFIANLETKLRKYKSENRQLRAENKDLRRRLNNCCDALDHFREGLYSLEILGLKVPEVYE